MIVMKVHRFQLTNVLMLFSQTLVYIDDNRIIKPKQLA